MEKQEAMDLVARAIRSGIFNDLGSGSNVDLCIITAKVGPFSYELFLVFLFPFCLLVPCASHTNDIRN